jgi:hypothetical protein
MALGIFVAASTAALADPINLICDTHWPNDVGPGGLDLDEAAGSVTVHYASTRIPPFPESVSKPFPAKFDPNSITFDTSDGEAGVVKSGTINRLTGIVTWFYNGRVAATWNCQVGKKQF